MTDPDDRDPAADPPDGSEGTSHDPGPDPGGIFGAALRGEDPFGSIFGTEPDNPATGAPRAATSDVRRYHVPCPHCGHAHEARLAREAEEAYRFECLDCGEPFPWMPTEDAVIPAAGLDAAAEIRVYRAPCPHCRHPHDVKLQGEAEEAYRFECLDCGEPFAWMPTEKTFVRVDKPDGEGRTTNAPHREPDPVVRLGWVIGLALGLALALTTPAQIVPNPMVEVGMFLEDVFDPSEWLLGVGVPIFLVLAFIYIGWSIPSSVMKIYPRVTRPLRTVRALLWATIVGDSALLLLIGVWPDWWLPAVGAATVWGTAAVALGLAGFVVAHRMRTSRTVRARQLVLAGVPGVVIGLAAVLSNLASFGALETAPPFVRAHVAERQLDEAREAAATASTEAERERAEELFFGAGVNASRSGDLDRLEEALDAYIEFEEDER